jgi:hypothetical protein
VSPVAAGVLSLDSGAGLHVWHTPVSQHCLFNSLFPGLGFAFAAWHSVIAASRRAHEHAASLLVDDSFLPANRANAFSNLRLWLEDVRLGLTPFLASRPAANLMAYDVVIISR